MKRILSGIQPSGNLCLGNYLGALKHWVDLQETYQCFFMIADLHTITVKQDPLLFQKQCLDTLAIYLAAGLDPQKTIIFLQSSITAHSELTWLLNCYTYVGELNRMTQFKDKSRKYADNINAGLFDYPVLMAADILLYQAHLVPVGKDQKQHLEITRDLAQRLNNLYGSIFTLPQGYEVAGEIRIRSLQNPTQKMSKSETGLETIFLLDDEATIINKFKRAVTDSGKEIYYDWEKKPGITNLLTILSILLEKSLPETIKLCQGMNYGTLKNLVSEKVCEKLLPLQKLYHEYRNNEDQLIEILKTSRSRIEPIAQATLNDLKNAIGFLKI